ncbi:4229_t:CDS:2, partial [Funneliformis caledonium]
EGHIARYCSQLRQQPRETNRRSQEYYEEGEYEVYLNTRSGPYLKNAVSKNKRRPVKFQNPPKITVEELEMKEPTPEPVVEP